LRGVADPNYLWRSLDGRENADELGDGFLAKTAQDVSSVPL